MKSGIGPSIPRPSFPLCLPDATGHLMLEPPVAASLDEVVLDLGPSAVSEHSCARADAGLGPPGGADADIAGVFVEDQSRRGAEESGPLSQPQEPSEAQVGSGRSVASHRKPELENSMSEDSCSAAQLPGPLGPSLHASDLPYHDGSGDGELGQSLDASARQSRRGPMSLAGVEVEVIEEEPAVAQLLKQKLDALNAAERPSGWEEIGGDYLDDYIGSDIEQFSREELLEVLAVSRLPWGSDPQKFKCPYCHIQNYSANHWEHTYCNYIFSALLCASGCCFGCCLAPLCIDFLKNTKHVCTNCRRVVGYRRACAPLHDGKHVICCCGLSLCVGGGGAVGSSGYSGGRGWSPGERACRQADASSPLYSCGAHHLLFTHAERIISSLLMQSASSTLSALCLSKE